jgi:hypothetical protein
MRVEGSDCGLISEVYGICMEGLKKTQKISVLLVSWPKFNQLAPRYMPKVFVFVSLLSLGP